LKNILIIPGSLRTDSSSYKVINEIIGRLNTATTCTVYDKTRILPHFNDDSQIPEVVSEFRLRIMAADLVIICTPEYAFGVPGTLKNALDWTVGSGEFLDKPVALITASSVGERGHESLQHILGALSARLTPESTLLISAIRSRFGENGKLKDENVRQSIDLFCNEVIRRLQE
jgi:chromate reductase, NAD(P)H dehydrogenase (quinone)